MFLGTDDGLYISLDAGGSWKKYTDGFPTVPVNDLIIQARENDLVIATFGRSIWVLDDIEFLREIAKTPSILSEKLKVFDPPIAYLDAEQQPTGSRFGADAIYNGENRKSGALIKYYFQKENAEKVEPSDTLNTKNKKAKKNTKTVEDEPLPKDEDKLPTEETNVDGDGAKAELNKAKDTLFMKIYDKERLIRTLKTKVPDSSGMYVWQWRLDEAGSDRPSRKNRERPNEPGGVTVKPGSYKIVLENNGNSSSTFLTVESDPRLPVSEMAITENYAAAKKLESMTQLAADAVKQLVESKNTVEDLSKKMKDTDKKKYKAEIKESKEMVKKIDSLIAFFIGKEDKRQGITQNKETTVMDMVYTARGYVSSRPNGLTSTEWTLILNAETQLKKDLDKTNKFYQNEWPDYEIKIKSLELSPFQGHATI